MVETADVGTQLLLRCEQLLVELEDFGLFLAKVKAKSSHAVNGGTNGNHVGKVVDVHPLHATIQREANNLKQVLATEQSPATRSEKTVHFLRSSNVPFYAAVWQAAKSSRALSAFHKRFYHESLDSNSKRDKGVVVDIVAADGLEWVKVSTVSEHRLTSELDKVKWELYQADDSDDESSDQNDNDHAELVHGDEFDRLEIMQTICALDRIAQRNLLGPNRPVIRLVMPSISNPPSKELSPMFDRLRSMGVIVETSAAIEIDSNEALFTTLLPSAHPPLTDNLNLDCTILLALISDLSHDHHHAIDETYKPMIKRQIALEKQDQLLVSSLYPAMSDKGLYCTAEAMMRMNAIVQTIGTDHERARAQAIFDDQPSAACRARLQLYSEYPVPDSLLLPVHIVQFGLVEQTAALADKSAITRHVQSALSPMNSSVFLYGWTQGMTTITSNRVAVKLIEKTYQRNVQPESDRAPLIWLKEPARSLLGKEKARRGR